MSAGGVVGVPPNWLPTVGDRVRWAEAEYDVAAVNGDLLTLEGVVDWHNRTCRVRCTVLASDIRYVRSWQREHDR